MFLMPTYTFQSTRRSSPCSTCRYGESTCHHFIHLRHPGFVFVLGRLVPKCEVMDQRSVVCESEGDGLAGCDGDVGRFEGQGITRLDLDDAIGVGRIGGEPRANSDSLISGMVGFVCALCAGGCGQDEGEDQGWAGGTRQSSRHWIPLEWLGDRHGGEKEHHAAAVSC